MRHREAWAVEKRSPSRTEAQSGARSASVAKPAPAKERDTQPIPQKDSKPQRRIVAGATAERRSDTSLPRDILVVASKVKKYIKARAEMSTSDRVMDLLSDHVRRICEQAIRNAKDAGRKTVLDRDIPKP